MPIMSIYSMIAKYICNFPKRIMEMPTPAESISFIPSFYSITNILLVKKSPAYLSYTEPF